jgi:hypothetical protein
VNVYRRGDGTVVVEDYPGVPGGRLEPFRRAQFDRYQARAVVDSYWSTDNDLCRAILHVLDEDEEDEEE